jgi:hypothetical protein
VSSSGVSESRVIREIESSGVNVGGPSIWGIMEAIVWVY